jgi:hypothetical protein
VPIALATWLYTRRRDLQWAEDKREQQRRERDQEQRALEERLEERVNKAVELLGSEKLDVRIAGIYALGRVARDPSIDDPRATQILATFIREHSSEPWPPPFSGVDTNVRATTRSGFA